MTIQEHIEKYKTSEHLLSEREKAVLERQMWSATTREIRQSTRRDAWLQSVLGGETGYIYIKRAELLNAEPASDVLWQLVEAKSMTTSRAVALLRVAKVTAATEALPLDEAVQLEIAKYNSLPHVTKSPDGYDIRKSGPVFEVKKRARRKSVKAHTDSKEFYSKLKQDCAAFLKERIGNDVDSLLLARLLAKFEVDIKSLLDEWQTKIHGAQFRAQKEAAASPDRRRIIEACRTLVMDPPKPGKAINMKQAKKQKRSLVRVYHPDVAGEGMRQKYHDVIEAYDTLELYSENKGELDGEED